MSEAPARELFERCERFEQASAARASTTVKELELGTAYLNADLPVVRDRNFVWFGPRAAQATSEELIEVTEEVLSEAGVDHRKFLVAAEHVTKELAEDLRGRGWALTELLTMALRDPSIGAKSDDVEERTAEEYMDFNRTITGEFSHGSDPDVVEQLVSLGPLMERAANARFFVAKTDGKPVAGTHVYSDGRTTQIEDVGTLEAYRGRGFSRTLMKHVIADAFDKGHDMVFLVAESDDWPKDFYSRLGFEIVGRTLEFRLGEDESSSDS